MNKKATRYKLRKQEMMTIMMKNEGESSDITRQKSVY
jgi:hypothetical protein